nr:helix-turn-helix transcriptional regulator [Granulicella sp. dw_53]
MEQNGWIGSEWGLTATNQKAKYYTLTSAGTA